MTKTQALLVNLKARDALMTNYLTLDKKLPISQAVKLLLDGQAKSFLITDNEHPYGVISSNDIVRGIKEFGEEDALHHITQTNLTYVDVEAPLSDVFSELKKSKSPIVLVTSHDQMMGIIDAENLAELILVNDARKSAHI
jgi:predicted transcriptional regulator